MEVPFVKISETLPTVKADAFLFEGSAGKMPRLKRNAWLRGGLLMFVCVALIIGVFVLQMVFSHNFHVVSAGQMYRSAQLNAATLTRIVQQNGIKSILNLRGPAMDDWYGIETNTAQQLGVVHYDYLMYAGHEATDDQMEQILTTIEHAPKPMLIHCKSGADRTGLVGALYLYACEGKSPATATRELSVFSGHVPYLFWSDTAAMDRSFWHFVGTHAQIPGQPIVKLDHALARSDESQLANGQAVN
jgi:protein tyrosine phosphatase (PTP) superfamily phosphohydrolase (DUF442 family)